MEAKGRKALRISPLGVLVFEMEPLMYRFRMPPITAFVKDVEGCGLLLKLSKSIEG
jgi:hypothetical protein